MYSTPLNTVDNRISYQLCIHPSGTSNNNKLSPGHNILKGRQNKSLNLDLHLSVCTDCSKLVMSSMHVHVNQPSLVSQNMKSCPIKILNI